MGEDSSNRKALEPVIKEKMGKMAFSDTKVEKQGDREIDRRPTCCRWNAIAKSCPTRKQEMMHVAARR